MLVNAKTEIAIEIIRFLKEAESPVSHSVIAENIGVGYAYVVLICRMLKYAGIIDAVQGCTGGALLTQDVITLYDVMQATKNKNYDQERLNASKGLEKFYKVIDKEASKIIIK